MDACIPQRAGAYRAFWLRQATAAGRRAVAPSPENAAAQRDAFDRLFPDDAALRVRSDCARAAPQP
jgi:hypothetical protein